MSMTTGIGVEIECKGCGERFPLGTHHDCAPTRLEFRALERRLVDLERALRDSAIQASTTPGVPWPGDSEE